jgi:phosphoadenosine phosphosulfate reductase
MTERDRERQAAVLAWRYGGLEGEALLRPLVERDFTGRIALLSSFGAEAALLLDMVARIDRRLPVIFLDTGKLFGETLRYRDALVARLGLTDLRVVAPDPAELVRRDADGTLWHRDADACCRLRKVELLARALVGFDAVISGRKRYQSETRAALAPIEADGERIRVNPLAGYDRERIAAEFATRGLPPHPLEADGFRSIGCMPCTDRVVPAEDPRAGRWRGLAKTECGIHSLAGSGA